LRLKCCWRSDHTLGMHRYFARSPDEGLCSRNPAEETTPMPRRWHRSRTQRLYAIRYAYRAETCSLRCRVLCNEGLPHLTHYPLAPVARRRRTTTQVVHQRPFPYGFIDERRPCQIIGVRKCGAFGQVDLSFRRNCTVPSSTATRSTISAPCRCRGNVAAAQPAGSG
jgi:hypothetical protein